MARSPWLIIKMLREAESPDERREILLALTKKEKHQLFNRLYFERGAKLNISGYDGYTGKSSEIKRLPNLQHTVARACIKKSNAQRVLEVGCATGDFVKALRKLGDEAFGVDVSPYALSKVSVNVRDFFHNIDVETERLPFGDEFFDMIVAFETLEHLANITYALGELGRVLKAGGFLFITSPKPLPSNLAVT